ncbi:MAG: PilZ domain-containing protein [Thermodesulfobacteriota bacterium]
MSKAERRAVARFALTLPAVLSVSSRGARRRTLHLSTSDVSSSGAFFACAAPMEPGTKVRVSLLLPSREGGVATRVKVSGFVVRATGSGMAVRFTKSFRIKALPFAFGGARPIPGCVFSE